MEYNPYKVLGVKYTDDLETIRNKFKKLVLKHHPDRGGDPNIFNIIKKSYQYLYHKKKNEQKYHKKEIETLDDHKKERKEFKKKLSSDYQNIQSLNKINPKNMDQKHFNKLFNHFKVKDPDERGYEIQKSDPNRLEQKDIMKKYKNPKKMQIAIIKEPEPIEASKQNYKKLGLKHVDDFSKKHSEGQEYTDLQKAYTNQEVLENNMRNVRKESYLGKNIDRQLSSLQSRRSKVSHKMSEQDRLAYELKMEEEKAREAKRQLHMNHQDKISERQFFRMQNYITFNN
jgi:curved DNA-binding protein CbpA